MCLDLRTGHLNRQLKIRNMLHDSLLQAELSQLIPWVAYLQVDGLKARNS